MEERDFSPKHSQNHEQRSDSASQVFTERVAKEIHAALDAPLVHPGTVNKGKAFTVRYGGKSARLVDEWLHRDLPGLARKRIPT